MSKIITLDQQQRQGLRQSSNYLPARHASDFTLNEQSILRNAVDAAGTIMARRQMSHIARSDDTAITSAVANLIYSAAYAFAALLITGGLFLMAWLVNGREGNAGTYITAWLIVWGVCVLAALAVNRWQGLWFSSTGIAHAEIKSRERIAMYTVDRHIELLEKRWELEA